MTSPFMPYGQPPPQWVDPTAGTSVQSPAAAPSPNRRPSAATGFSVLAVLLAFAAFAFVGLNLNHAGTSADVTHLQTQITALQQQHAQDQAAIKSLTTKVTTLDSQQTTLGKQVGSMTSTVHNLAPFANGQCTTPIQGRNGPISATFPCRT